MKSFCCRRLVRETENCWALEQPCRIFLIFHIVKHPDDLKYMVLHNRSTILSVCVFYFLCVSVQFDFTSTTNFHSLNFCSFSIYLVFASPFLCRSQLFRILCGETTPKWDIPEAKVQKKQHRVLHDSVPWYYLSELRVLHTICSSISIYYVLRYSNLFVNAARIYCMVAKNSLHTDARTAIYCSLAESNFWPNACCVCPDFVFQAFSYTYK